MRRKPKPRRCVIDGREYDVSIRGGRVDMTTGDVPLHVTFRACFGIRSCCLVRGVTNRMFWYDYPDVDEMRLRSISVTPKVAGRLVTLPQALGWDPDGSAATAEVHLTTEAVRALAAAAAAEPAAAAGRVTR